MLVLIALLIYLLLIGRTARHARSTRRPIAGIKAEAGRSPARDRQATAIRPSHGRGVGPTANADLRSRHAATTASASSQRRALHQGVRRRSASRSHCRARSRRGTRASSTTRPTSPSTTTATSTSPTSTTTRSRSSPPKGEFLRRFPDPYKPTGKGEFGQRRQGYRGHGRRRRRGQGLRDRHVPGVRLHAERQAGQQFGRPGSALGDLDHPNGVVVDADGRIIVSDSNNNRVVRFSPIGRPVWKAGKTASVGASDA